jgi:tetratricopeptide (TPR) repeat protein
MNQDELQQKLDQASSHYNDALYDEAVAIWKEVLQADPDNPRAREGLQMVELLTQDFSAEAPAGGSDPAQVNEAVQRVEELLEAGDLDAAREGVEVLQQIAPDDPRVQQCASRLEAGGDSAAYVAEQLALARHYVMMEEPGEGMEACRRVLSVDPNNDEAKELLSQVQGGADPMLSAPAGPPAATAEGQAPASADEALGDDDLLTFDLDALEDSPAPAAPPVSASPPPVAVAPEPPELGENATEEERIAALITRGDHLEAQGDLQEAIQVWSRVFILEDSHAEAEERVDRARRTLEEQAIRVDEIRFKAEDLWKGGNLEEAKAHYQQVLEILPKHQEALNALEQIETQMAGGETAAQTVDAVPLDLPDLSDLPDDQAVPMDMDPEEVPLLELQESAQADRPQLPLAPPPKAAAGGSRRMVMVLGLVLAVAGLGVGGYMGWQVLFPAGSNGDLAPQPLDTTAVATKPAPVEEPVQQEPAGPDAGEAPGPTPTLVLSDEEAAVMAQKTVTEGEGLYQAGDYAAALQKFRAALDLDPGNMDAKDWETTAAAEVQRRETFEREIATVRTAFADFDYESALKKLYRTDAPTEDGEVMVKRWIVTSWYNWGVLRLQGARLAEAAEKFQEVLDLDPSDEEAANHLEVVGRYDGRATDATFKNYADRVQLRALD